MLRNKLLILITLLSLLWPRIGFAQSQDVYFYPLDLDASGNGNDYRDSSMTKSHSMSSNGLWAAWFALEPNTGSQTVFHYVLMRKDLSQLNTPAERIPFDVNTINVNQLAAIDIDNSGKIAFSGFTAQGHQIFIVQGSNVTPLSGLPFGTIGVLSLAGNGNFVSYTLATGSGQNAVVSIHQYNLATNTNKVISTLKKPFIVHTDNASVDSSDNGTLAIIATDLLTTTEDNQGPTNSVYVYDPTDDSLTYALPMTGTVTNNTQFVERGLSISPNGRYIAFSSKHPTFSENGLSQILVFDLEFGLLTEMTKRSGETSTHAMNPIVNNQKHVLYQQMLEFGVTGSNYLRLYDEEELTTLTGRYQLPNRAVAQPQLNGYALGPDYTVLLSILNAPLPVIGGEVFYYDGTPQLTNVTSGYDWYLNSWSVINQNYFGRLIDWDLFKSIWGANNTEDNGKKIRAAENYFKNQTCRNMFGLCWSVIGTGGVCGGMATTASLAYTGDINYGNYPPSFTWSGSRSKIADSVIKYQWLQQSVEGQEALKVALADSIGNTIQKVKTNIANKLKSHQMIAIRLKDLDGTCGLHALLPFGYTEDSNSIIIAVYDPNHPTGWYNGVFPSGTPNGSQGAQNIRIDKATMKWTFDMTASGFGMQNSGNTCNAGLFDNRPVTIGVIDFNYVFNTVTPPWTWQSFIGNTANVAISTPNYQNLISLGVNPDGSTIPESLFGTGIFTATATDQNATVQLYQPDGSDLKIESSFTSKFVVSDTTHYVANTFGANRITQTNENGHYFLLNGDITGRITSTGNTTTIEVGTNTTVELQTSNDSGNFGVNVPLNINDAYIVEPNTSTLEMTVSTDVGNDGTIDQVNTYSPSGAPPTPTFTPTVTPSITPSVTPTATVSVTPSVTPTATLSVTPSATPTNTAQDPTPTPIPTGTPTAPPVDPLDNRVYLPAVMR